MALRVLVPLLGILAALAWGATRLVNGTMRSWFERAARFAAAEGARVFDGHSVVSAVPADEHDQGRGALTRPVPSRLCALLRARRRLDGLDDRIEGMERVIDT